MTAPCCHLLPKSGLPARAQAPPAPTGVQAGSLDAEVDTLWAQLQQALATKRVLRKKLTYAENMQAVWGRHRERVNELAFLQHASSAEVALHGAQKLASTLRRGWQSLRMARRGDSGEGDSGSNLPTSVSGPRGLQQRFMQRRAQISTVSVPDLGQLSSLLCAS